MLIRRNNSEFRDEKNTITRYPLRAHSLQFTLLEGQPLLNELYIQFLHIMAYLQIKEVAPKASSSNATLNFWTEDLKVIIFVVIRFIKNIPREDEY